MDFAIGRPELVVEAGETGTGRRWDIFLQLNFCIPAAVLLLLVVAAILAPQVSPYDPLQTSLTQRLQPPAFAGGTGAHLLGTDKLGRDVLGRIIFGARVSLSVSLLVILGVLPAIGLFWMVIPPILALIVIAGVIGTGVRPRRASVA